MIGAGGLLLVVSTVCSLSFMGSVVNNSNYLNLDVSNKFARSYTATAGDSEMFCAFSSIAS
jgi:hypothetical protein